MTHTQTAQPQQDAPSDIAGADQDPGSGTHGAGLAGVPAPDGAGSLFGPPRRRSARSRGRGLHGQVVQQLGQMIVSGDIGADRPLVPEDIGEAFEVSRTVVRESLRVLEAKGLVSARPNVGTRVRPVSDWSLFDPDVVEWRAGSPQREEQRRELAELRWMIEPLAARLAAEHGQEDFHQRLGDVAVTMAQAVAEGDAEGLSRADGEFHGLLLGAAGNQMLTHLAEIVSGALRASGMPFTGCDCVGNASLVHHVRIVEAVAAGHGAEAGTAMRQLLTAHPEAEAAVPAPREP
ncbi:FadR/GntR family transcriptional regulator [Streptomyces sp. SAI-090]|jgi:DNA-binding FadR family transcriptional regulator|uniref:FadR/GntR family transcriptional regulator n=1 Tax=Streptomyces sp. SAI-090 TaxID=2940545 RepID=UPI0024744C6F|nr:FadR/GntR family transcriptional regulator [Streptomyces sp. SAI-090]MDH6522083.1 DNA-binding FadR family transcriptional regulator [Streptomyces sp. SAI-090]